MKKYVKLVIVIIIFIFAILLIQYMYSNLSKRYRSNQKLVTDTSNGKNENLTDSSQNTSNKQEMMDFTVINRDNEEIKLSSLLGKPVVLNFWASWCLPCKDELPDFQKAYDKYGTEIEFVMVNLTDGSRETLDSANKFLSSKEYTFPVYYDTKSEAALSYTVYSIPTTYFLNKDGKIVTGAQGMIDLDTIEEGISMIK